MICAELSVSPQGHVYVDNGSNDGEIVPEQILSPFDRGSAYGLLHLGINQCASPLPATFRFWQEFARRLVTAYCKIPEPSDHHAPTDVPPPNAEELTAILASAPFMKGGEYLTLEVLTNVWNAIKEALHSEVCAFSGSVQEYLQQYNPNWNLVGRVCFHLAENKNSDHQPFAFLATYTTKLLQGQAPQHLPLQRAILDYAGDKNHALLLALLMPVQKAAQHSLLVKELVDSGAIFQPQAWTAHQAHRFLQDIPLLEQSGVMIRVPNWWNPQKPPRPKVTVTVGDTPRSVLGLSTLLDFKVHLALHNGEQITREEWEALVNSSGSLVKIKGQWVEIDQEKLRSVLSHWDTAMKYSESGVPMAEALRLLSGAGFSTTHEEDQQTQEEVREWSTVHAGEWLKTIMAQLKNPKASQEKQIENTLKDHLRGTLRPYQMEGVSWLYLLYQLKLGGCLADDMGLGKTIQILSLITVVKHCSTAPTKKPHLLVVPASLLGNWQAEIARFTPTLQYFIAHSSASNRDTPYDQCPPNLADFDLVITTYGFLLRSLWLKQTAFDMVIVDEAQCIKNPDTKQTRAVKALTGQVRFTLTGTPIENKLSDLWSLFDFTSPGLLGSSATFSSYAKAAKKGDSSEKSSTFITAIRSLTQPYILRRLKSDKKIIKDLPNKTEMKVFCPLTKEQVVLYQQTIEELARRLEQSEGIQRRGLVLSYLLRFKQICNHPTQLLGVGEYSEATSGKFQRLQEICEEIAEKQEKVLIFTQFREIIPGLCAHLTKVFGREGLALHGNTPIKKRQELVDQFQREQGAPFFVLSLKAGGTGLNLRRASHVIHFDRWWNPAVENQATDRAYRIGQTQPVLVHKFICRGTMEEKIDEIISSKTKLSSEVLERRSGDGAHRAL